jgi:hypothetical protein
MKSGADERTASVTAPNSPPSDALRRDAGRQDAIEPKLSRIATGCLLFLSRCKFLEHDTQPICRAAFYGVPIFCRGAPSAP